MLKLSYIICYILFLLAVILLFAIVNNTQGGSVAFYLLIFVAILLGTTLFALALINLKTKSDKQISITQTNTSVSEKSESDLDIEQQKEAEHEIDIEAILPLKATEINRYAEEVIQNMADKFNIMQALFYVKNSTKENFVCNAQFAYFSETKPKNFKPGESLPGQAVKNKNIIVLNNIPDNYMTIASGLGKSKPKHLVLVPLKNQDEVIGLIEYATFEPITEKHQAALEGISKKVADTILKLSKK
jgi:transcriptional regulator with GAF, ATPase, and Fis domain